MGLVSIGLRSSIDTSPSFVSFASELFLKKEDLSPFRVANPLAFFCLFFHSSLVAELEAYLSVTGLKDTHLSPDEEQALLDFDKIEWGTFNLEKLFGKSTRGKRLKSDDRIPGILPFVTAGEADEGVSAFIGNVVDVFSKNTTTIDMFGSAKYRNYAYGGDDHVAIVHTEELSRYAAVFVTSAIHKSSHNGQFDYGHNFYAKDADALYISLPVDSEQKPDYGKMAMIISAVHKLVIRDVVAFSDRKIEATRAVAGNQESR